MIQEPDNATLVIESDGPPMSDPDSAGVPVTPERHTPPPVIAYPVAQTPHPGPVRLALIALAVCCIAPPSLLLIKIWDAGKGVAFYLAIFDGIRRRIDNVSLWAAVASTLCAWNLFPVWRSTRSKAAVGRFWRAVATATVFVSSLPAAVLYKQEVLAKGCELACLIHAAPEWAASWMSQTLEGVINVAAFMSWTGYLMLVPLVADRLVTISDGARLSPDAAKRRFREAERVVEACLAPVRVLWAIVLLMSLVISAVKALSAVSPEHFKPVGDIFFTWVSQIFQRQANVNPGTAAQGGELLLAFIVVTVLPSLVAFTYLLVQWSGKIQIRLAKGPSKFVLGIECRIKDRERLNWE